MMWVVRCVLPIFVGMAVTSIWQQEGVVAFLAGLCVGALLTSLEWDRE